MDWLYWKGLIILILKVTEIFDQIERDEVEIVAPGNYACYHGRGTVATCAPGTLYAPQSWFSKYPEKRSPMWNLVMLVDPISWLLTFLSILSVSMFFVVSARIGGRYFGVQTFREEIIISPFRST